MAHLNVYMKLLAQADPNQPFSSLSSTPMIMYDDNCWFFIIHAQMDTSKWQSLCCSRSFLYQKKLVLFDIEPA